MQCPFCMTKVEPHEVCFVADDTLKDDPVLGPGATVRFHPVRFTPDGAAVAPNDSLSTTPACPSCRAAWLPEMRTCLDAPTVQVGPGGIAEACAKCTAEGWTVERHAFPETTENIAQVVLLRLTQGQTSACIILGTAAGAPEAVLDSLPTIEAAS